MKQATAIITACMLATAATAGTAFYSHEIDSGGFTKVCVYDYLGSPYAITIKSTSLCPLTIEV